MIKKKARILCFTTSVAPIYPSGINSRKELSPGPKVIPKELIATKIAENLLCAQTSTLIAVNFLVINLEPPAPNNILPAINKIIAFPFSAR